MTAPKARRGNALLVSVTDARGRTLRRGPASGLGGWLTGAAPRSARGAVTVAVVPNAVLARLNRRYRGVSRATDVLSFVPEGRARWPRGRRGPLFLGDIAIARGMASRQARDHGHSVAVELRILALHGLLHLLGYDHEADSGEMRRLEERLRRRAGLPAGLIARS